jgi:CRP-like cAMP-binding protein
MNNIKHEKINIFKKDIIENSNEKEEEIDLLELLINDKILQLNKKEKDEKKLFYQIPFIKYENTIELLLYAIQKKEKSENDIKFISHYLTNFPNIINIHNNNSNKNYIEPSKILYELSNSIKVENKIKNTLIMRFGDIGDKFYIIFKGNVSIIIKKEIEFEMTEYEYYLYLKYLKKIKEYELIEENLRLNNLKFDSIDLKNCLDGKLVYQKPKDETEIEYNEINIETLNFCTTEVYIQRIKPLTNKMIFKQRKRIIISYYYHICDLKEGDTFGEIALRENVKRTASIICNEDCIFGTLTKKLYDNCIKGAQEKIRLSNINFLLSCELFNGVKLETFDRKYFNYFKFIQLNQDCILFNQGDFRKDIYILKEGLIEITIKTSYKELIELIKAKNGELDEYEEMKLIKEMNLFVGNLLNTQRYFRLFKKEENEVIGLDDYVNKDNFYICNAICKNNCSLYSMDYNVYKYLCQKDWKINDNFNKYKKQRFNLMANRMLLIRTVSLNMNLKEMKNNSDMEINELEKQNCLIENPNKKKIFLNTFFTAKKLKNFYRNKVKNKNKNYKLNSIVTPRIDKNKRILSNINSTQSTKFSPLTSGNIENINQKTIINSNENIDNENKIENNNKEIKIDEKIIDNFSKKVIGNKIKNKRDNNNKFSLSNSNSISFIKKKYKIPKLKLNDLNRINNENLTTSKNANPNILKSDSSNKKLFSPIKKIQNNYLMQKIREYKTKIYYSTLIVNSTEEEKEKKLIDKIYQRALNDNLKNKILKFNNNISNHKRILSDGETIDKVDLLLMDNTIRNYIPNKTKINFNIKLRRIPLNYKSHSPKIPITKKTKLKILGSNV